MRPKLTVVLLAAVSTVVRAQTPAMAPEFQVGAQSSSNIYSASVASDAAGNFVVVWDSGYDGVRARLYDESAAPQGPPFTVAADGGSPKVAMNPAGEFVFTFSSAQSDVAGDVFARRYDTSGDPLGSAFQVNVFTTAYQGVPAVAMDASANFVVVWSSTPGSIPGGSQDGSQGGVFGRRFASDGTPLSGDFQINTYTTAEQTLPEIAATDDGFVVVWTSRNQDGPGGEGVFGQRYDASGNPEGSEFPVNTSTPSSQAFASIAAAPDGSFVVVWESYPQLDPYAESAHVVARRFGSDGGALGDEFQVNTYTTGAQFKPHVAFAPDGDFMVSWGNFFQNTFRIGSAQRFDGSGQRVGAEFPISQHTTGFAIPQDITVDGRGQFVMIWLDSPSPKEFATVFARRGGFPDPRSLAVDAHPSAGTSNVNGVLEPGERVTVGPIWWNTGNVPLPLAGTASNFTGPGGATYTLEDPSADYGAVGADAGSDCYEATTDCVEVSLSDDRPAFHWDTTLGETLSTGIVTGWKLHVGGSFADVPTAHVFYGFIENLFHSRITGGCGGPNYCPGDSVTRAQMAVFLLKAKHGFNYVPPDCAGTVFADVPCTGGPFDPWIEDLAARGITGGCGGGNYCPTNTVTRGQMAVFLLKTFEGSSYDPPDCAGVFDDVPCTPGSGFSDWIEQLSARQITGGCSVTPPLYCPNNPNNRGQMAVFLVKTFGLRLYGAP